jgi:hypothetical protein
MNRSNFQLNDCSELVNSDFLNSYIIKREIDRFRVPGEDDGEPMSITNPAFFAVDPWENLGQRSLDLEVVSPYLDIYALTGGVAVEDELKEEKKPVLTVFEQYQLELDRSGACGFTSAILQTDDDEDYYHQLDCRKAWCPRCGGRGGKVHQARKRAIRDRIDITNCNLRYFVFTVPERYRILFKHRAGINQLFRGVRGLIKRYFGSEAGAVAAVHLYGDKDVGKFNPHINVIMSETLEKKLKITPEKLGRLRESWRRSLIGMGCVGCVVADVYYQFRLTLPQKGHCIKYVVRPTWDKETLGKVDDEEKYFLVLELKGFQYLRFWGAMANCKYREVGSMTTEEARRRAAEIVGKPMHYRCTVQVNIPQMLRDGKIEKVSEGLYRIKKGRERNG